MLLAPPLRYATKSVVACNTCSSVKRRCSGKLPCERCVRLDKICEFPAPITTSFLPLPDLPDPNPEFLPMTSSFLPLPSLPAPDPERMPTPTHEEVASAVVHVLGACAPPQAPPQLPECLFPWRAITVAGDGGLPLGDPLAGTLSGAAVALAHVPADASYDAHTKVLCGGVGYGSGSDDMLHDEGQLRSDDDLDSDKDGSKEGLGLGAHGGWPSSAAPAMRSLQEATMMPMPAAAAPPAGSLAADYAQMRTAVEAMVASMHVSGGGSPSPAAFVAIYEPTCLGLVRLEANAGALALFGWNQGEVNARVSLGLPLRWLHPSDIIPRAAHASSALQMALSSYSCSGHRYLRRRVPMARPEASADDGAAPSLGDAPTSPRQDRARRSLRRGTARGSASAPGLPTRSSNRGAPSGEAGPSCEEEVEMVEEDTAEDSAEKEEEEEHLSRHSALRDDLADELLDAEEVAEFVVLRAGETVSQFFNARGELFMTHHVFAPEV